MNIAENEASHIYNKSQSDTAGYYANEADGEGLIGVYKAGFEAGQKGGRLTEKLLELASRTECSLYLEFNPHKDCYQSAKDYFNDIPHIGGDDLKEVDLDKDIWVLRVYNKTPISFYEIISNDLETAIDQILTVV